MRREILSRLDGGLWTAFAQIGGLDKIFDGSVQRARSRLREGLTSHPSPTARRMGHPAFVGRQRTDAGILRFAQNDNFEGRRSFRFQAVASVLVAGKDELAGVDAGSGLGDGAIVDLDLLRVAGEDDADGSAGAAGMRRRWVWVVLQIVR